MNYIVPILAYLCPLLLGLVIAFLVATSKFTQQGVNGLGRITLYYITLPLIGLMLIIGLIPSSAPFNLSFVNLLYLAIFLWGWLVMVAGVSYLFIKIGLNKNITYIIVSFIILLLNSTIFYINPFISAWQDNPGLRQAIIDLAVKINPLLTIASSFFHHDLLRSRAMYSLCDIGPYYFYSYANWPMVLLCYVLIGVFTFGLGILIGSRRVPQTDKQL